jgi:hypothetical protein
MVESAHVLDGFTQIIVLQTSVEDNVIAELRDLGRDLSYVKFQVGTVVDDARAGIDLAAVDVLLRKFVIVADVDKDHQLHRVE